MKLSGDFLKMKQNQEKIVMLTAYDFPSAKLAEQSGVDMILVGDSLGMVVLGYESTIPVTVNDMIHHTKAVKRGAPNTFVVTDMPFMSYHLSMDETLKNAARIMQEGHADAVKLEGADDVIEKISALTKAGIPVVAHLGLTPQSVGVLGGYKVQGKDADAAAQLVEDAKKCEAAGAMAVVFECVPYQVGELATRNLGIPTIGIGAGADTDGQVLVYHDVIRYGVNRVAKFVKVYGDANELIGQSINRYVNEVKSKDFPSKEHSFTMKEEQLTELYGGKR
ncbi:3-methyl-2-oxobutanoate hydroxymethyltransferase [Peribacillus simplex]|uniref:3-methyl-2-oxobutanoate hydroxymethyltransferase n=1 Tax=Peribacillus simplex TaxID=1478 RepID=A0AAW7IN42_9BACI|nr:3-methyl-2-oxobutanoate hydroxymethyltransferase [Peribacillus simplex]AMM93660.1 3-methyl-2-oxobutanoate hydroxymethyltransferase [Peribacillus simplex]MDF9760797.1 3-methyl-2-oxobutanoate hydroxymethyltransferase [Peribacillus simplex]MDM5294136.1 3-methyl-2-oxobutanoate hydroxymethyltransferase [Peribacillus simplex]MDM5453077.1 3-methyl-2-oxobutanoate hydroxymethyltransferase [Peribacillus simplex]MDW7614694.1 3-methyl-2-oxobutanoate hydroxymethyltransferase [Peribacillus simplex]